MRRDSIWFAGKNADIVTGGCNIRMFLFPDALYGSTGTGCCSHLINNGLQAQRAMVNFGEYNWHKTNFLSEWTVYHVTSSAANTTAKQAGAAISSKGGSYAGTVALNPGDPQGAGGPRKYFPFTNFNLSQQNIDTTLANINPSSFTVDFPNDTICLGDSADFTTNLTPPVGYVKWDFGDGTFDSVRLNTKHLYTSSGTFTVTIIAWSTDSLCQDTVTKSIHVNPSLSVDFTFDTACLSSPTTFTNTTIGNQSTLRWSFGDGNYSTFKPDTSHVYGTPGVFPVTLFVRSSSVCADSITKNVLVNDRPDANFLVSNDCQYLNVSPSNTTSLITANLATLNWEWDFGDGGVSSVQNPTTSYSLAGNYNIELIATTPEGCSDTTIKPIVISEKPTASYNVAVACLTQTTDFIDASTLSSGAITSWQWSSPVSSNSQNTSHVFSSAGAFPITLTVTTDSSCVDDTTINVVVRPLPIPSYTFSPSEIFTFDTKVCFVNTTSGGVSYFWDFDFDGSQGVSNLNNPCTVSFPSDGEGRYNVKLVATNQYGCKDSLYKELVVIEDFFCMCQVL